MSTNLSRSLALLTVLLAGPLAGLASAQIDYKLSFDTKSALWTVEGKIANPKKAEIDYWIPRWTAGAYHLADFGRWVEELQARDGDGKTLAFERVTDGHFHIAATGADPVLVRYTARSMTKTTLTMKDDQFVIDVEANRIAADYAFVNPPSLFGFVPEAIDAPVSLAVELPAGWTAATVLPRDEGGVFHAPSYYRFEDSPLLFAPSLRIIDMEAGGKPCTVAVLGQNELAARKVADGCKKIVEAASKLMGGLPYDRYEFLLAYVENGGGSGLEHSFSTLILMAPEKPHDADFGTIAHEFFHLWCAERIHTAALQRPDYTQSLRTGTIWVNEAITEYFTQHVLLHAGVVDRVGLLSHFFEPSTIEAYSSGGPAPSLVQVSQDWEKVDGSDDLIHFLSRMYSEGPKTMLALDLAMRRASGGEKGVIDLLHYLMSEYASKDRGFGEDEMPEILKKVAGADMSDFYGRYIAGGEKPDLGSFLDVIGYRVDVGKVVEVAEPTAAQLKAREDFFSTGG